MFRIYQIALSLFFVSLISCEYIKDIEREGEMVTKTYELDSFSRINIEAPFKAILTQDTVSKVVVECYDYLLDEVKIIQESSLLTIDHDQSILISEKKLPSVHIYSSNFSSVTLNASGKLYTDTIKQNSFKLIRLNDAAFSYVDIILFTNSFYLGDYYYDNIGTFNFSGSANFTHFILSGQTELNARNLQTKKMTFVQKSAADCDICVIDSLDLDIYSSGDVYLYGTPKVDVENINSNVLSPSGRLFYMPQ